MTENQKAYQILFDYEDIPTLKRFALDNSRMRLCLGPFGCLSSDTEFLTPAGWKKICDYTETDILAEFDLSTSRIFFHKPSDYIKLPCDSFLHLKNRYGIDQLLSDEHIVLFNTAFKPEEWRTIPAGELAGKHNSLNDGWSGRIPTIFKAPETNGIDLTGNEIRLMVAVSADGHFSKKSNTNRCHICVRKERKKIRLRMLLTECGIDWNERNYEARPTETTFDFDAPERNKLLWKYFNADESQLAIIADEFVHWDGCLDCYGGRIYASTIKENADFIQYVLTTTGVRATIAKINYNNDKWKTGYRVYANTGTNFLSMRNAPKIERVPSPDGFKYCFKTSTGFFVARRNGKIFITGNSAKSSACVMEVIRRALAQTPSPDGIRRSRWAVVRNTYSMLKDTTIKTFHDWFPPKLFGEYRVTDHTYIITKFPGVHLEIMFRALDRPDQVSNLLSLEVTGAWFNEAREIPIAIIDAMDGRIGRYPSGRDGGASWYGIIMDSNPPSDDSVLYKRFEVIRPEGWKIFKQPSGLSVHAENTKHLPKNYYINLAKGKDEMYKRIYIDGQYGYLVSGKPVFQSFRDNIHVAPHQLEPQKGLDVLVGMDFALQPACIIGQITTLGQLQILDEVVSEGMGLRQFCDNKLLPLLRLKYFGMNVMGFGDPSGVARAPTDESTCFEVLQGPEVGLRNIVPAPTNAILPRVAAVENFLNKMYAGEPSFILSPNCHYLRKAMNGGYHYEKDPRSMGEEYKIMPVKNFSSHCCFSGKTMILTPTGEKRIDEIRAGDFVVTPFGNRKVIAAGLTHKKTKVIEITFSDERKIECTEDHEFIKSNKSIAKSNALRYSDVLQDYNSWRTLQWSIQSLLSLKKRNTGFRQVITTGSKIGERQHAIFTELFGKVIINVKFLKDMISTILMEMYLIMIFPILRPSMVPNIPDSTCLKELKTEPGILKKVSNWRGKQRNPGMGLLKESSGIVNMEKKHGLTEKFISHVVCIAGKILKLHSRQERNSVMQTAKTDIDTTVEKTTFKERVLFVVKTLQRINILKSKPVPRIVQISQLPELKDVYNITVDIDHVFYANGILSCNCDALEYLCMFIAERDIHDKRWKDLSSKVNLTNYKPVNSIGGY